MQIDLSLICFPHFIFRLEQTAELTFILKLIDFESLGPKYISGMSSRKPLFYYF
jgi:hypothetical protein